MLLQGNIHIIALSHCYGECSFRDLQVKEYQTADSCKKKKIYIISADFSTCLNDFSLA